jgi:hypothetical protein
LYYHIFEFMRFLCALDKKKATGSHDAR